MSNTKARFFAILLVAVSTVVFTSNAFAVGGGGPGGLSDEAFDQLEEAGVFKYLGQYEPISSEDVGDGWTKHTFDSDGGDGPTGEPESPPQKATPHKPASGTGPSSTAAPPKLWPMIKPVQTAPRKILCRLHQILNVGGEGGVLKLSLAVA